MQKKVLFLNEAHPLLEDRLRRAGFECDHDYETPAPALHARMGEYFGVVLRSRINIDRAFIESAPALRFIAREGVGLEHIDLETARARGIEVFYSPEGSRDTVAEHTLGLMLGLLNNLPRADRQIRAKKWIREGNRGVEMKGKTVGILGYGNMGQAVARRLSGFGVRVIAYDKYKTGFGDDFAREVSLETLFAETDILTAHIFYEPDNHHFINDAFLASFAKNIFVINTARGLVLNTADLVKNLRSGKVRGAALDVLEYEEQAFEVFDFDRPPEPFRYLLNAENVVLSPHIAGWSFESKEGHARVLAEKIEQWLSRRVQKMTRQDA
ncbi:MAG: hydroxyacid dehydrogenase [Bacteroidetes bacterium]|nr:MAG: hydroxyacid dehydrogenase [Bacteroidota bacterium]